jgi:hypothetical protein
MTPFVPLPLNIRAIYAFRDVFKDQKGVLVLLSSQRLGLPDWSPIPSEAFRCINPVRTSTTFPGAIHGTLFHNQLGSAGFFIT